jgi:hypothetical protein
MARGPSLAACALRVDVGVLCMTRRKECKSVHRITKCPFAVIGNRPIMLLLQRRASTWTRKGRCKSLNLCMTPKIDLDFRGHAPGYVFEDKDPPMAPRSAEVSRKTKETEISVSVHVDGTGRSEMSTGVGFFDHMLDQLPPFADRHDRQGQGRPAHRRPPHCRGLPASRIGQALSKALGERRGIMRYASIDLPWTRR